MGDSEYEPGAEPVSSDKKFEVMATEAGGYYQTIVTIATAMMGGSILFLEKIAPHPIVWTIALLAMGWLALLGSIFLITDVRLNNLESLRHALECEYELAKTVDSHTRKASDLARWALVFGMLLIAGYGLLNLVLRNEPAGSKQHVVVEFSKGSMIDIDTLAVRLMGSPNESHITRRIPSRRRGSHGAK